MEVVEGRGELCRYIRQCPGNRRVFSLGSASNGYQVIGRVDESLLVETQDADYSRIPPLIDELELMILARIPIVQCGKVALLNKRYKSLFKNGKIFKIRRELGIKDLCVFVLASGDSSWWVFDGQSMSRRRLPKVPADDCFFNSDKETLCVGTHLIVSGMETSGSSIWRYELAMNKWFPGPSMNDPRCLFASATCGDCAFVAGGIGTGSCKGVLDSAEKYNPESKMWERLPHMLEKRKHCSGIYMDGKFFVLGGQNERGESLTCGEVFGEENMWVKIDGILKDSPVATSESPPLVAVVSNQLYSIETCSNQLKVYLKERNSWKRLGPVPVTADFQGGWGVAFKSLGNELLVMGGARVSSAGHGLAVFTCCPDPDAEDLQWKPLNDGQNRLSHFIRNCSVMAA